MSFSFAKLYEYMELDKANPQGNPKVLEALRAGINVRDGFWDDFINVMGNGEGVSELLDVPKEKIGSWASKIKEGLDQIKNLDATDSDNKSKQLSTGDDSIADPDGDNHDIAPDLQPTP